jgi:hypothetical protein
MTKIEFRTNLFTEFLVCGLFWSSIALTLAATTACSDVETVSTQRVASPNGAWVAVAKTERHSGPGAAGVQTIVSLQPSRGNQAANMILLLSHDPNRPGVDTGLKMSWLTNSHLEIAYRHNPSLDFQAIKDAGVDISVKVLSD